MSRSKSATADLSLAATPAPAAAAKVTEHFIPVRKQDLVDSLCAWPQMTEHDQQGFRRFCELLSATLHFECHEQLETLKNAYAPFDPDADTMALAEIPAAEQGERLATLFTQFASMLEKANFNRLSQEAIEEALASCSDWGLNLAVDFDVFDRLEIYYRGDIVGKRSRRRWRNRMRLEEVDVPIYQRLVLIFRLRASRPLSKILDTQDVFIKVFKDIPKMDLEMLLPGTQVKMSLLDRAKIVLPTLSGIAITAMKIIKGAMVVAAVGLYGVLATLGMVAGTLGYAVRSFFGYMQTKQKYQLSLTQSLYYQNLDNNAGVLFRVLDEAEEQENREALLAYFFLWKCAPAQGWSEQELDEAIEAYLRPLLKRDIDFEVGDALNKLVRMRLLRPAPSGKLRAVCLDEALETLDEAWDNYFNYNQQATKLRVA